jgi:hypothetical protein
MNIHCFVARAIALDFAGFKKLTLGDRGQILKLLIGQNALGSEVRRGVMKTCDCSLQY